MSYSIYPLSNQNNSTDNAARPLSLLLASSHSSRAAPPAPFSTEATHRAPPPAPLGTQHTIGHIANAFSSDGMDGLPLFARCSFSAQPPNAAPTSRQVTTRPYLHSPDTHARPWRHLANKSPRLPPPSQHLLE